MEKTIPINLTTEEIDTIGASLGKLPYEQVFKLIYNISQQYKTHIDSQKEGEEKSL